MSELDVYSQVLAMVRDVCYLVELMIDWDSNNNTRLSHRHPPQISLCSS